MSGHHPWPPPKKPTAASSPERVMGAIGRLQDATAGTEYEPLVDELVDALADDTTAVELRQEIEFRARRESAARPAMRP